MGDLNATTAPPSAPNPAGATAGSTPPPKKIGWILPALFTAVTTAAAGGILGSGNRKAGAGWGALVGFIAGAVLSFVLKAKDPNAPTPAAHPDPAVQTNPLAGSPGPVTEPVAKDTGGDGFQASSMPASGTPVSTVAPAGTPVVTTASVPPPPAPAPEAAIVDGGVQTKQPEAVTA